jgi:hypothetical protein
VLRGFFLLAVLAVLVSPRLASGQHRGVIDDPDGFTNVRAQSDAKSAIVATVKRDEVFTFVWKDPAWSEVTLGSGKKGYMHSSRIRLYAMMSDLAYTKPNDEVNTYARRSGLDYFPLARAAARGETAAMQKYFAFVGDGAAAERHLGIVGTVIHLMGDQKLAEFLKRQPVDYREMVRETLTSDITLPFEAEPYLKRCFPKTAAVLFR